MKYLGTIISFIAFSTFLAVFLVDMGIAEDAAWKIGLLSFMAWTVIFNLCMMREKE